MATWITIPLQKLLHKFWLLQGTFANGHAPIPPEAAFFAESRIFAQAGQVDMAEALTHAAGVHDTSTVTHRDRTRHTDVLFATIQAIA